MFQLSAETAHEFGMFWLEKLAHSRRMQRWITPEPSGPPVHVMGLDFPNVAGLAAGFDKNALAIPAWQALGFGFIEVGTITAQPQPGNEKPRLFRVPEMQAIVNRMGFNNEGAVAVAARLDHLFTSDHRPHVPLGINIGKSKVTELKDAPADYAFSMRTLHAFGDYFVVNVSSPNTPGLRSLQGKDELATILDAVMQENTQAKPVLVKIAPDLALPQIDEVVELAESAGLAGIIATNTTLDHTGVPPEVKGKGGLSGAPLLSRSTEIVRHIRSLTKLCIIGSGGIMSAEDAKAKLQAGADLVQIYTGLVYRGPKLIRDIAAISNLADS